MRTKDHRMLSIKLTEKKDGNPTKDYCSVSLLHMSPHTYTGYVTNKQLVLLGTEN